MEVAAIVILVILLLRSKSQTKSARRRTSQLIHNPDAYKAYRREVNRARPRQERKR